MKTASTSSPSMQAIGERLVALLLVVQAITALLLWTLNSFTTQGQNAFALFLATNFVAFAMMSYIYRALESDSNISKVLVVAGSCVMAVLLLFSTTIAS